jgi:hypothetical protein
MADILRPRGLLFRVRFLSGPTFSVGKAASGAVYTYTISLYELAAYNLMQIGWAYDSLYDKNIERLQTIRFRVRIAVRESAYDLVLLSPRKAKRTFPGI